LAGSGHAAKREGGPDAGWKYGNLEKWGGMTTRTLNGFRLGGSYGKRRASGPKTAGANAGEKSKNKKTGETREGKGRVPFWLGR